ncbi:MAG: hypothetical protein MJZ96_01600 [Paludibacteraceae bacterium]|nr:hypothetical protein [Paludibacteraceae bacterium]
MLNIHINGRHASELGLTPLKGCLSELMAPPKRKQIITNTNTNINGDVVLPLGTAVQSRTVTLFFKIEGNGSLIDLQDTLELLEIELLNGTDGNGTNEIFVEELGRTFYLVYQEMSDYSNFGEMPKATLRIKFLEPNPRNH